MKDFFDAWFLAYGLLTYKEKENLAVNEGMDYFYARKEIFAYRQKMEIEQFMASEEDE